MHTCRDPILQYGNVPLGALNSHAATFALLIVLDVFVRLITAQSDAKTRCSHIYGRIGDSLKNRGGEECCGGVAFGD
jgi:hypothetical protein